jgi:hypothetical protein
MARAKAMPSAPEPPYWYELNVMSRPCVEGRLVAEKRPPSSPPLAVVKRR